MRSRLTALFIALATACGPEAHSSRLVLAEAGTSIECSDGRAPALVAMRTAQGPRAGFEQAPSTRCSIELDLPERSRLLFRVSVDLNKSLKGLGIRVEIHARLAEGDRTLYSRGLIGLRPVAEGSVELPAGASQFSLWSDGAVIWTGLEVIAPVRDPGPEWIVDARTALAPFLASHDAAPREDGHPRLLVIGVDGGNWHAMRRLIDDGDLPTLAALRARGSWGVLRSTPIPSSAMSWAALGTGMRPAKTGGFLPRDLPMHMPPFWDRAAEQGVVPLLIAVPGARADGPGVRIGEGEAASAGAANWAQPAALVPLLARAGYRPRRVQLGDARRMIDQMNRRSDVGAAVLSDTDWDLAFFVFGHTDAIAKHFELYSAEWKRVYRAFDTNLARLLGAIDSRTTVLLVSSHGWSYFDRSLALDAWLHEQQFVAGRVVEPSAGNVATVSLVEGRLGVGELEARLAQLRDPDTGKRVIRSTRRIADVFAGDFRSAAPGSVIVEAETDYLISDDAKRGRIFRGSADGPSRDGIYLLAGPGVEPGEGGQRSVYDIAPSVLHFFGVELLDDLDGVPLPGVARVLPENER